MAQSPKIGVLALQGGVREHKEMLEKLDAHVTLVRQEKDLAGIEGLVLPGGESSAMDRIMRRFGLVEPLKSVLKSGLPLLGTCAGLITISHKIIDPAPRQESLDIMDIDVRRNAFGPQRDSAVATLPTVWGDVTAAFIRAPEVVRAGESVEVISTIEDSEGSHIVGVKTPTGIGISFHPELTGDTTIHEEFLRMVENT